MPSSYSHKLREILERCAVPGLIRYVVLFNALVFVLHLLVPGFVNSLTLDPGKVLHGEIWRLVTWIFIPETLSPFWVFFALLFLLYVGDGLEEALGSAKLTLFYLSGVAACTLVSFLFGLTSGGTTLARANTFLNLSLLLGYATVYPDFKVLVFFVLPIRIAWLAIASAALMIFSALGQPPIVAATLAAALLNFLLFFHRDLLNHLPWGTLRVKRLPLVTAFKNAVEEESETLHRCVTCGRTEQSHPELDFRVAASGDEYCREHLPTQGSVS